MNFQRADVQAGVQSAFEFYGDLPQRPKRPERLFFALLPDAEASRMIAEFTDRFMEQNGVKGERVGTDRLHVRLQPVGEFRHVPPAILYGATLAGAAVSAPPFELTFHAIQTLGGKGRPLALMAESGAVSALQQALGAALKAYGFARGEPEPPHLALLHGAVRLAARTIDPIRVMLTGFALVRCDSDLSRCDVVHRWPLAGA